MHNLDRDDRFPVDQVTEWARAGDYLVAMFEASKPVADFCHGPLTLIDGDLVAGRSRRCRCRCQGIRLKLPAVNGRCCTWVSRVTVWVYRNCPSYLEANQSPLLHFSRFCRNTY
jgi:hypothetical protein